MDTTRIELHGDGFKALLQSPEVLADLDRRAAKIAAAAGEGMETDPATAGGNRARARVYTATRAARQAEATDRTLTRAIDAGRG